MIDSWKQTCLAAVVVVAAMVIGGLLQAWSLGDGPTPPSLTSPATTTPAAIVDDVPASCPASSSSVIHPAFRPAAGEGPVYMNLGLHPVVGQRTLSYHGPDARENFPPGFGGQNVIFGLC